MVSSKGEPDNPELREKVKNEVKSMSKGGGPGSWSAWKAGELARRYEAQGGGYLDKGEHKNKSQKGPPEKKQKQEEKKDDKKEEDKKEEKSKDDGEEKKEQKDDKEEKKDEGKTSKSGSGKAKASTSGKKK